jgi:hypothetical protein
VDQPRTDHHGELVISRELAAPFLASCLPPVGLSHPPPSPRTFLSALVLAVVSLVSLCSRAGRKLSSENATLEIIGRFSALGDYDGAVTGRC